ncbi:hypothetical protein C8J56DRAFT_890808 [Mycena floridula]|nr:hypothetical protein C8J56DRAFT_890808 [Mycena floridula]
MHGAMQQRDESIADAEVHDLDGRWAPCHYRRIPVRKLHEIKIISSHLKMYSSLVRRVNIVLEVSGVKQRVEVITSNDDLTAELIVVASHAGAQIHSLSPDIVPPDFRIISTQALRAAIHLGSIDSILTNTDLKLRYDNDPGNSSTRIA